MKMAENNKLYACQLIPAYHRNEPPKPLKRVHSKNISSGSVGQESCEDRFFDEAVDENSVLQDSLLEERKSSGLANDHISPLDDDDRGEEHGVASELEDLSLRVRPLLPVGIGDRLFERF